MNKSLALLAILSFSVACSKVEKAEKNMQSMKTQTEQMSQTTEQMEETTNVMYQQVRSKEAEDTRNKKFSILKDKKAGFGEKIAAASVYFKSFEFQLWSATGTDDLETRDVLLLDAVNEFTKKVSDIYEKINVKRMSPTRDGRFQSDEHAFYALAVTMHMNHHFQDQLIDEKNDLKAISFYDIIKSALDKDDSGEALTEYEEILVSGANKEIMTELIKARVDMLAALALKNLTDKRDMTLGQTLKAALFKISGGKLGSIDLPETFTKSNGSTRKQTIKYLENATKARDFLLYVGVKKELEKTLKSAFSKINLGDKEPRNGQDQSEVPTVVNDEDDSDKMEIKNLINGLIK